MSATGEHAPRRILVGIDASRPSLEALAAAAALASRFGADLEGLFVEDVNLLRAAGLPLAAQLSLPSGSSRPLDRPAVERELRALAARAREALASAAAPGRISWSFRVARGQVPAEVLEAARHADLLVVGRTSRRVGTAPGETARAVAARAPVSTLVLLEGSGVDRPLLVVYDGSPAADRALDAAKRLESREAGPLTVLAAAGSAEAAARLAERARRRLARREEVPSRWMGGARRQDLVRAARRCGSIVVLDAACDALLDGGLDRLLEDIDASLLLTR